MPTATSTPCGFRWCPCPVWRTLTWCGARGTETSARSTRSSAATGLRWSATAPATSAVTMPRTSRSTPWRAPPHTCATTRGQSTCGPGSTGWPTTPRSTCGRARTSATRSSASRSTASRSRPSSPPSAPRCARWSRSSTGSRERQRTALLLSVFEGSATRRSHPPRTLAQLGARAALAPRVHLRKAAAAIAPLPLLQSLLKKASTVAGASGGSQGTLVAGGSIVQAKLVAVAATTVVAGAATVDRAASNDGPGDAAGAPSIAQAADLPRGRGSRSTSARCFRVQPPGAGERQAGAPCPRSPRRDRAGGARGARAGRAGRRAPARGRGASGGRRGAGCRGARAGGAEGRGAGGGGGHYASDPDPPGPELPPEEDPAGGHEPTPGTGCASLDARRGGFETNPRAYRHVAGLNSPVGLPTTGRGRAAAGPVRGDPHRRGCGEGPARPPGPLVGPQPPDRGSDPFGGPVTVCVTSPVKRLRIRSARCARLPALLRGRRPDQRQGLRERGGLRDRGRARLRRGEVEVGDPCRSTRPTRRAEGVRLRHQPDLDHAEARRAGRLLRAVLHRAAGRDRAEGLRCRDATTLADLKDAKLGVQIGTTSLEAVQELDPAEHGPAGLQRLQRHRARAQDQARRRDRRRPADGVLPHRRPGARGDHRRPVRRPGGDDWGAAAGEGLAAHAVRDGGDRGAAESGELAGPDGPVDGRRRRRPSSN